MNTTTKGISRQSNGNWSYRFVIVDQDNVRHDVRKTTDENGHPLTSQKAAIKAKNIELNKWKNKIAKKGVVLIDKDSVTISALFSGNSSSPLIRSRAFTVFSGFPTERRRRT